MWAEIKASPVAEADMLDDLKHGNKFYTGVETDKGYPKDGLMDEYPDNFSFHEKFERIENKLLGRDRWDV